MCVATTAGLALALAACSGSPVGGTASSTSSSTSSAESLPPGTPNVAHALDTSAFQKAPCSALTTAQLAKLNVGATGVQVQDDPLGPECAWKDSQGPSTINFGLIIATAGSGLSGIYGQKSQYAVFEPLSDIAGYPAIVAMTDDARPQGDCKVSIGVSNQLIINVEGTVNGGPDKTNPCPRIQAIATAMVTTMKGGS
nr:DUF3558 family protein [Kutzneria sp. 744]